MHSSFLRGKDFSITVSGDAISHADFFSDLTTLHRVGVVAPNGYEGVGALMLIMAHMTAFYDRYRETHEAFRAYPDYYAFQNCTPLAEYTMLDIWPEHKNVFAGNSASERLDTIVDRAINTLIVPDGDPLPHDYSREQLAGAERLIDCCYAYSYDGLVNSAEITISSFRPELIEYAQTVFETPALLDNAEIQLKKDKWLAEATSHYTFAQSYRRIPLEEALGLL